MKNILLCLLCLLFSATPDLVSADTVISGTISTDTTWSPSGGVYVIDSSFSIAPEATLTIEAGTIVKAKASGQGGPSIYGNLVVNGTSEAPVYFTSFYDDLIGGDTNNDGSSVGSNGQWQGLYFKPGSAGNFENVILQYSGYGGFGFGNFVGIENTGGTVSIRNSKIQHNYANLFDWVIGSYRSGTGVSNKSGTLLIENSLIDDSSTGVATESGSVTISNSVISNNQGYSAGYGVYAINSGELTLTNNIFSGNTRTAYVDISKNFVHNGNTSEDHTDKGFTIFGEVHGSRVLTGNDLPYIVNGIIVGADGVLTLEAGAILKMNSYPHYGHISVFGDLVARGSADKKIYITSIKDDSIVGDTNGNGDATMPVPRDWNAIFLEAGSKAEFDNVVLRYGGFNYNGEYMPGVAAAVYQRGSELFITNSTFERNFGTTIFQDAGVTTVNKSNFVNGNLAVWSRGGSITISQSNISNNTDMTVYNQSGPTIDARNNWWGSNDGPYDASTSTPTGTGDRIDGDVLYVPFLTEPPGTEPGKIPVIIIPGIMGSYLNKEDGTEVWMNLLKMALPGDDSYLMDLGLSNSGVSNISFIASDIIRKINIPLFTRDIFHSLIDSLSNDYLEDRDLFVFPYDWRLDISESALKLNQLIEQIKQDTESSKVQIIAHSMGGLVFKEYLKEFSGDSVNKFIDLGTPHFGAPRSLTTIMYGNTDIAILNKGVIKIISRNMPSVYQLLPSPKYGNYLYDLDDFDQNGIKGLLNYHDTKEFLKNTGRNPLLVDRAEAFHSDLDDLSPSDYGVETYNIVGCGIQTLDKIFIVNKEDSGGVEYNISYTNGDGTVPLKSAQALVADKIYYVKNAQHALMPSTSGIKDLISDILNSTTTEDLDMSGYPNLATTATGCKVPNGKIVSFHSPIDLHIYDLEGNHAGPNAYGDIENNIPGVSYEVIDGNKFAFLPDGLEYIVKGEAISDGTFNARIQSIENESVVETKYFNNLPLTHSTEVNIEEDLIQIDHDANGVIDLEVSPSAVLDETQSLDVTKPVTGIQTDPVGKKSNVFDKPVKVKLTAVDDNSGVLKTEYSINDSPWLLYTDPFTISNRGENKVLYRSTDRAGNVEQVKSVTIIINPPGNSGKR